MTSYFDKRERMVAEVFEDAGKPEHKILACVKEIEAATIKDIDLIILDEDFPEDLRNEIAKTILACRIEGPGDGRGKASKYLIDSKGSLLIRAVRSLFNKLDSLAIEARFGLVTSEPDVFLLQREAWNREHFDNVVHITAMEKEAAELYRDVVEAVFGHKREPLPPRYKPGEKVQLHGLRQARVMKSIKAPYDPTSKHWSQFNKWASRYMPLYTYKVRWKHGDKYRYAVVGADAIRSWDSSMLRAARRAEKMDRRIEAQDC